MLLVSLIGNIGSDARVEKNNGRPFVSFSVGHNDTWTDQQGVTHTSVQWCSCALNGDGGKLLQYLKKGKSVFVLGRATLRVYSSEKERRLVAGMNISVDRVELLTSQTDEVPRTLFDKDGVAVPVGKSYYVSQEAAAHYAGVPKKPFILFSQSGQMFDVLPQGWVTRRQDDPQQNQEQLANGNQQ